MISSTANVLTWGTETGFPSEVATHADRLGGEGGLAIHWRFQASQILHFKNNQ
jgi:hypothetical protein